MVLIVVAGQRSGYDAAIGARGLGFDYRAGQIGHSAPTAGNLCDVSSELVLPRR